MKRTSLLLGVLLVWSCALRLWLATPNPTAGRFWDERYGIENIHALIVEGQLRPANGFHPGFSYLPHAALCAASEGLYRLTGWKSFAVFDAAGAMTPTGYLLCRFLQVLAGTLSIYLTYRIGRQLFSPGVGLLGAFLLAIVPWHLRQSVIFKPDIALVAAVLFAFDRSLAAAARPAGRRFLQAGLAVGMALATKLNGGPAALPLLMAALSGGGWRERRSWQWLFLAGAAAVAVFLLCTPFLLVDPHLYVGDFSRTLRDYTRKGARHGGSSHLHVLWHGVESLFSSSFHGPVIGALAVLGIVLWAMRAVRGQPSGERMERLGPAMLVSCVLGYALLYSLSTLNRSEHNWLPVVPFTALAAAWVLVRSHAWLMARIPVPWHRAAVATTAALVAAVAVLLAVPGARASYRTVVPTTDQLAGRLLAQRLQPLPGRIVLSEQAGDRRLLAGRNRVLLQSSEHLRSWAPAELDRADAVVFPAARLEGTESGLYRDRLAARNVEAVRIAPAPFRARGSEVLVLLHPWRLVGGPVQIPLAPQGSRRARLAGQLADVRPDEILSLEILLPPKWPPGALRQVLAGGRPIAARSAGREGWRRRILTHRFAVAAPAPEIVLVLDRPLPERKPVTARLRRWQR